MHSLYMYQFREKKGGKTIILNVIKFGYERKKKKNKMQSFSRPFKFF